MRRSLSQACAESPEVHLLPFAAAFGAIVSINVVGRICVVQLESAKTRSCVGCDIGTNFGSLGRNGSLRRSFSAFAFAPHFYLHYKQPEEEGEHFSHMKANLRRLSTTQPKYLARPTTLEGIAGLFSYLLYTSHTRTEIPRTIGTCELFNNFQQLFSESSPASRTEAQKPILKGGLLQIMVFLPLMGCAWD